MLINLQPRLENDLLILRPLTKDDFEALFMVASDSSIWEQHPEKDRGERKKFEIFFKEALESKGAFAVINKKTAQIIGSSRFAEVKDFPNAIEIGWTFLARIYWGGLYNRSLKTLMMDYAFNFIDMIVFYIHHKNIRSQKSIEKLGGERIVQLQNRESNQNQNLSVTYIIHKQHYRQKFRNHVK